jgi:hypothetical protein
MFINIYWRIIFGASFIIFVYGISTTVIPEYRKYKNES